MCSFTYSNLAIYHINSLSPELIQLILVKWEMEVHDIIWISSVQFRYGSFWADQHPSSTSGTLHTFAFDEAEHLEMLEYSIGYMVHLLRFTTNKRSSDPFGVPTIPPGFMPLNDVVYFSGAEAEYCGVQMVTNLVPRMTICNPSPAWEDFGRRETPRIFNRRKETEVIVTGAQLPVLLTWMKVNPSMDK